MQIANWPIKATALLLLSFLPSHQRIKTNHIDDSPSAENIVFTSENNRAEASFLAKSVEDCCILRQKRKMSLDRVIAKLSEGKEPDFEQSVKLLKDFSTYNPRDFHKFLIQVQRDMNDPQSKLYQKLHSKTRDYISKKLREFLEILNKRIEKNGGQLTFGCKDLPVLLKCNNDLRPTDKAFLLEQFREQCVGKDNSQPTHASFFLARTRSNAN